MASADPMLTLERMLNGKTTLKTQKVTHSNIICIGTEVLNEINQQIQEDKNSAVKDAVAAAEARALTERNEALRELGDKMNEEREQALEEARIRAEEQMAEIKYRCQVAEKKRARALCEQYQQEKNEALEKATEKLEKEKQRALQDLTTNLTKKLQNIAALEREKAVAESLAAARKKAEERRQKLMESTRRECEKQAMTETARVARLHAKQVNNLNQRIHYIQKILDTEREEKKKIQETFLDMRDDYKRFQDYTKGFHSDFVLRFLNI